MNGMPLEFLEWEEQTNDTLDFKGTYVDVAGGNLVAGLVLSQIVYWYLPDRNGKSKLRKFREGQYWIAAPREEWANRLRISTKQYDGALKCLAGLGLIEKRIFKFRGDPTVHVRLIQTRFIVGWIEALETQLTGETPQNRKNETSESVETTSTDSEIPVTKSLYRELEKKFQLIISTVSDYSLDEEALREVEAEKEAELDKAYEECLSDREREKLAGKEADRMYEYSLQGMWELQIALAMEAFGLASDSATFFEMAGVMAIGREINRRRWDRDELKEFCQWHFRKCGIIQGSLPKRQMHLKAPKRRVMLPRTTSNTCDYFLHWKDMKQNGDFAIRTQST